MHLFEPEGGGLRGRGRRAGDEAKGGGCGNNGRLLWSADDVTCGAGEHVVVIGRHGDDGDEEDYDCEKQG